MDILRRLLQSKRFFILFGVLLTPIFLFLFASASYAQLTPGLAPEGFDTPGANVGSESGIGSLGGCVGSTVQRDSSRFAVTFGLDADSGDCSLVSGLGDNIGREQLAITFYPGSRPEFFELGSWILQSSSAGSLEPVDPAFPSQIVRNVPDGQPFTFVIQCEGCGGAQYEVGATMQGSSVTINSVKSLGGGVGLLGGLFGGGAKDTKETDVPSEQEVVPSRIVIPCDCSKAEAKLAQLESSREAKKQAIASISQQIEENHQALTRFYSEGFSQSSLDQYIRAQGLTSRFNITSEGFNDALFASDPDARSDWYTQQQNKIQSVQNTLKQAMWNAQDELLKLEGDIDLARKAVERCKRKCVQVQTEEIVVDTGDCKAIQSQYKEIRDMIDALDCNAKKALLSQSKSRRDALKQINSKIDAATADYKKAAEDYRKFFENQFKKGFWVPDGYNDPSFGRYGFLAYGQARSNQEAVELLNFVKNNQAEISALQDKVNEAYEKYKALNEKNQSAPQEIQILDAQISQLEQDIAQCEAKREQLEAQAQQLEEQNKMCLKELTGLKQEADTLAVGQSEMAGALSEESHLPNALPENWSEAFDEARGANTIEALPCQERIAALVKEARDAYAKARQEYQKVSNGLKQFDSAWQLQNTSLAKNALTGAQSASALRVSQNEARRLLAIAKNKMKNAIALRDECLRETRERSAKIRQAAAIDAEQKAWDEIISGRSLPFEDGPFVMTPTDIAVRLQGELKEIGVGIDAPCDCPNAMILAAHNVLAEQNISQYLWGVGLAPLNGAIQALPGGSLAAEGAKALAQGALELVETGSISQTAKEVLLNQIVHFSGNATSSSGVKNLVGGHAGSAATLTNSETQDYFKAMSDSGYQMFQVNSSTVIQGVDQCNKKISVRMLVMYDAAARHMQVIISSPDCDNIAVLSWTFSKEGISNSDMRGRIIDHNGQMTDIDEYLN